MKLPCRICTDKQTAMEKQEKQERGEDVDVWKEMKTFSSSRDQAVLEQDVVRRGADLVCLKCRRQLNWYNRKEHLICCDGPCERELPRQNFNKVNQKAWEDGDSATCNECLGYKPGKDDRELTQCHGACGQMLPDYPLR